MAWNKDVIGNRLVANKIVFYEMTGESLVWIGSKRSSAFPDAVIHKLNDRQPDIRNLSHGRLGLYQAKASLQRSRLVAGNINQLFFTMLCLGLDLGTEKNKTSQQ